MGNYSKKTKFMERARTIFRATYVRGKSTRSLFAAGREKNNMLNNANYGDKMATNKYIRRTS